MNELWVVFGAVVGARFLLPLLIPVYPLPAIVACLVLDGVDQTIFQGFGVDPPGYQGYDKAMDVYYLAIAYTATLRNWTSTGAFVVGRFLYFYRLVGVLAFELFDSRALLIVFPNTFEYFFIAYELIRTRWDPQRLAFRAWVVVAALIWVVVKLPQEYWIHIAQLDVTDVLAEHAWAPPLLAGLLLALLLVLWFVVRPRLPEHDVAFRIPADPLPEAVDTAAEQAAWSAANTRVLSTVTFEKVALVGLLSVIFAQVLPGVRTSDPQLFMGIGVFVVVNAAIVLALARREMTVESLAVTFAGRVVVNVGLVLVAAWLLDSRPGSINVGNTLFFVLLLSLLTTLYDRFQPVRAHRLAAEAEHQPA